MADPGPGGLANVMTYDLRNPPGLVAGDVLLNDPGEGILDVIRFNVAAGPVAGNIGTLVFYSDNVDGFDDLADTPSGPTALYTNRVTLTEVPIGIGIEGALYTPVAGQPGFVAGASLPVTYRFISDTPEPASITLLGAVVAGVACIARKRARRATT
jgi:hypothetical protein